MLPCELVLVTLSLLLAGMTRRCRWTQGNRALGLVALLVASPGVVSAQLARGPATEWPMPVGSEGERYLRVLQLAGQAPPTSWSIRGWSRAELARLRPGDVHPWASSFRAGRDTVPFRWLTPSLEGTFNSRFPYGFNDGPVWAGRGLTTSLTGGAQVTWKAIELTVLPVAFRAENADFPILPVGLDGNQAFASAQWTHFIDEPQRFGPAPYQRLDAGSTALRVQAGGLTAGITSASEWWGPALQSPFLLGDNAGGFSHALLGTDRPLRVGPVQVTARAIAGALDQSAFSTTPYAKRRRYSSGIIGTVGVAGLELGVARVVHNTWPDSGVGLLDVLRPLVQGPFKRQRARAVGKSGDEPDNQLASAFARWAVPGSGFEVYGEFGREDNSFDVRDLLLEPDHISTYMLGFQRAWAGRATIAVLRAELLDSRLTSLDAVRPQSPPYLHQDVSQGHTQRGQVLGAVGVVGGGASTLAIDLYSSAGRRTIAWNRIVRPSRNGGPDALGRTSDVIHALTVERLRFGRRVDLRQEVTVAYDFNRDGGGDAANIRLNVGVTPHW